jgi:putative membrane protein
VTVRGGTAARVTSALGAAAGVVTLAGMIATPLATRGGATRRVLSSVVVTGLFTTTASRVANRWGPARAGSAAVAVAAATALVERVGTRTGLPFGRYHYTPALRPQVGGVPVIVPLAWFAMAVPAREAAVGALAPLERRTATATATATDPAPAGPGLATRARRVVLGAAALTAWDLFLDPQMVGEGYWRWARRGRYRGIPLSNYLGWFVTAVGVMAALELLVPAEDVADPVLEAEYSTMAVMETLGFAAFFRDPLVAAVGGAGMLPIAAAAACGRWRDRHWQVRHGHGPGPGAPR